MKSVLRVLIFASLAFVTACSISSKRQQQPANSALLAQLETAKKNLKSGQKVLAIKKLQTLTLEGQGTGVADDASILLGHVSFKERNYEAALKHYLSVVQSSYQSPRIAEARFFAARCHYFLDRFPEAQALLEQNQHRIQSFQKAFNNRSLELLYKTYLQSSQHRAALSPP